ncbi:MAG: glycoside hydrolase family 3 N-terminal domain-containing protein [Alloprevotella sp.]|nr:glycoside hydrolase family 3 N-terminal domain-containing protein [Alloprevotella sp.]
MKHIFLSFVLLLVVTAATAQSLPPYRNTALPIDVRVNDLLGRMTLDEKIDQLSHIHSDNVMENGRIETLRFSRLMGPATRGFIEAFTLSGRDCRTFMAAALERSRRSRLGIPVFTTTEALHGSVQDGSTIFPQSVALGSTFNPTLVGEMATAVALELRAQGINQILSPVLDVCRDLRWGRVEECFSEDPYLNTRLASAEVKAYRAAGISPMLKHFGPHGEPVGGLNLASVQCGPRDVLSLFLRPFETVVREGNALAVMSSYNSWNHEPNSSSHWMMTELLRDTWGFKGYVYSDWGAIDMLHYFHHTAADAQEAATQALSAGLDVEASGDAYLKLKDLVISGRFDMALIDRAVRRVLYAKMASGMFDDNRPLPDYDASVHTPQHIALARRLAEESAVLLKNEDHLLPLSLESLRSVALIGPNADRVQFGDYTWSRSNADGVTLRQALEARCGKQVAVRYAQGCDLVSDDTTGIAQAVAAARDADVSIVVLGSTSASLARDYSGATCGEGFDLSDLTLTGAQETLLRRVQATGRPVVLVLLSGKPFVLTWAKAHVPAILVQWYPGEQGGNALADILLGKVTPSGKLNYSFPESTGNTPCYYNYLPTDKGYYHQPGKPGKTGRDYVFAAPRALWAFGHGLSYTDFAYADLVTDRSVYGPADTIAISLTLSNTGSRAGQEVVQVYVRDKKASVVTPVQELKAFDKVALAAGQSRRLTLRVPVDDLALYDRQMRRVVEPGDFELRIGSASDDIRLRCTVTVQSDSAAANAPVVAAPAQSPAAPAVAKKKGKAVAIHGMVTDVQANPIEGATVACGKATTRTDVHGRFTLRAHPADTLRVSGAAYSPALVPIDGRRTVSVRLMTR